MTNIGYLAVSSEIQEIKSILSSIPIENVIERISFEARLNTAQEDLISCCSKYVDTMDSRSW